MSDSTPSYIVLNQRDQPVELHLAGGVVVVPPRGQVELSADDVTSPQLQALMQRRVFVVRLAPPPTEPEAETPSADAETPAPKRRRRS